MKNGTNNYLFKMKIPPVHPLNDLLRYRDWPCGRPSYIIRLFIKGPAPRPLGPNTNNQVAEPTNDAEDNFIIPNDSLQRQNAKLQRKLEDQLEADQQGDVICRDFNFLTF